MGSEADSSVRTTANDFSTIVGRHGFAPLRRERVATLQVNVGKLCNQACHHCHVDAGPKRTEVMTHATAERLVALLRQDETVGTVDLTGGAPELNPSFRYLVESVRDLGRHTIDRCNLTVLFEAGMDWLPEFLARNEVEVVCSLPCYTANNVESQRGRGVFDKSIEALQRLNQLGFGMPDSGLLLHLVYNPLGAFLPPPQAELEREYRLQLAENFGVRFHRLFTITNMPIKRFAEQLARSAQLEEYMSLLVRHFNPATLEGLMCRHLVSVSWDGGLYDCDFNQMLELPLALPGDSGRAVTTIWDIDRLNQLAGREITTAAHCFGCSAGAGSSCGGAVAEIQP
jgi:radical SAM/Cys-rich protein